MPPSAAYSIWETELTSDQFGRMWLNKFRFDIGHGNIPTTMTATLRSVLEAKLVSIGKGLPPLVILETVIQENPILFDLQGLRGPPGNEPYSFVIRLEVFAYFYLKRRVLLTILDDDDEELNFIWRNIDGTITSRFFSGKVRTDRAFFWCAPTKELETTSAKYTADRAATILRDRLGLHLLDKGHRLIRIDVPVAALVGKRLRAPNTLDSGANPAFVPSDSPDGYGRTLNLATITRDVKEIVAEEIPFDETFEIHRLGMVTSKVPHISWLGVEALII